MSGWNTESCKEHLNVSCRSQGCLDFYPCHECCSEVILKCISFTVTWSLFAVSLIYAEQHGDFTYSVVDNKAVITDFPESFVGEVTVPTAIDDWVVTRIGEQAFQNCDGVTRVVLPRYLVVIEDQAFQNCTGLESVEFNAVLRYIGGGAFQGCAALQEINLPSNLEVIDWGAFCFCVSLQEVTLPSELETLGGNVFKGCSSLTQVVFTSDLVELESSTFEDCYNLETVVLPDSLKRIGRAAFMYCQKLDLPALPANIEVIESNAFWACKALRISRIPESVTEISHGAFFQCESLQTLQLPSSLQYIGLLSFTGCSSLTEITGADDVAVIFDDAFRECEKLRSFPFGDQLWKISTRAFEETAIENVVLPESVRVIEADAFLNSKVKQVRILSSLDEFGYSVFEGCRQLQRVEFTASVDSIPSKTFSGCYNLAEVTLPSDLKAIGYSAFYRCDNLAAIELPSTLQVLSDEAFANCTSLTNVLLPESLEHLGDSAFYGSAIESIELPAGLKSLRDQAFGLTPNLAAIHIPEDNPDYRTVNGVLFTEDMQTLLCYPSARAATSYRLPDNVEEIASMAFSLTRLNEIDLGNVKTIGNKAFLKNQNLETLVFPSSVNAIGDEAFRLSGSLKTVVFLSSDVFINSDAFAGCPMLETYIFANDYVYSESGIDYLAPSTSIYFLGDLKQAERLPWGLENPLYYYSSFDGFDALPDMLNPYDMGDYSDKKIWMLLRGLLPASELAKVTGPGNRTILARYAFYLRGDAGEPEADVFDDQLNLRFYAGRSDIEYIVETSKDMVAWESSGYSLSPPDVDGYRTASVSYDEDCFMRVRAVAE